MTIDGIGGQAGVRVMFDSPDAGREWVRKLIVLTEEHANTDRMLPAMVQYMRELVTAFGISVEGIAGFTPNMPSEVEALLPYLTYAQARTLVADILSYECPDMGRFTTKAK